jgi:DNA-binding NarL/FixJ family response regulator
MSTKISCLLLVDSNESERSLTRRKLEIARVNIDTLSIATTLSEAISLVQKSDPQVILLETDLADSHALDTLRALRRISEAAIVVLSHGEDDFSGLCAIRAGADDYLLKEKLSPAALRHAIYNSLSRHELRQATQRMTARIEQLAMIPGVAQ